MKLVYILVNKNGERIRQEKEIDSAEVQKEIQQLLKQAEEDGDTIKSVIPV